MPHPTMGDQLVVTEFGTFPQSILMFIGCPCAHFTLRETQIKDPVIGDLADVGKKSEDTNAPQ
jgi:hypothetical protein